MNIGKWLQNETILNKISTTVWTIIKPIVNDLINNIDPNTLYQKEENQGTITEPEIINNNENQW
jgi:hypothetical protein